MSQEFLTKKTTARFEEIRKNLSNFSDISQIDKSIEKDFFMYSWGKDNLLGSNIGEILISLKTLYKMGMVETNEDLFEEKVDNVLSGYLNSFNEETYIYSNEEIKTIVSKYDVIIQALTEAKEYGLIKDEVIDDLIKNIQLNVDIIEQISQSDGDQANVTEYITNITKNIAKLKEKIDKFIDQFDDFTIPERFNKREAKSWLGSFKLDLYKACNIQDEILKSHFELQSNNNCEKLLEFFQSINLGDYDKIKVGKFDLEQMFKEISLALNMDETFNNILKSNKINNSNEVEHIINIVCQSVNDYFVSNNLGLMYSVNLSTIQGNSSDMTDMRAVTPKEGCGYIQVYSTYVEKLLKNEDGVDAIFDAITTFIHESIHILDSFRFGDDYNTKRNVNVSNKVLGGNLLNVEWLEISLEILATVSPKLKEFINDYMGKFSIPYMVSMADYVFRPNEIDARNYSNIGLKKIVAELIKFHSKNKNEEVVQNLNRFKDTNKGLDETNVTDVLLEVMSVYDSLKEDLQNVLSVDKINELLHYADNVEVEKTEDKKEIREESYRILAQYLSNLPKEKKKEVMKNMEEINNQDFFIFVFNKFPHMFSTNISKWLNLFNEYIKSDNFNESNEISGMFGVYCGQFYKDTNELDSKELCQGWQDMIKKLCEEEDYKTLKLIISNLEKFAFLNLSSLNKNFIDIEHKITSEIMYLLNNIDENTSSFECEMFLKEIKMCISIFQDDQLKNLVNKCWDKYQTVTSKSSIEEADEFMQELIRKGSKKVKGDIIPLD